MSSSIRTAALMKRDSQILNEKNDPASCSEKVCYRTSSMYHALWHSQKVKNIFWDFFYGFDCRNSKENATAVKLMMK